MTANPVVSVVCCTRNHACYLQQMIDSICTQTLSAIELIIVDDASEDDTPHVLAAQRDARIRTLRNPHKRTQGPSRNRAIESARGTYIAIQDADDFSLPGRLAEQLRYLEAHPDYAGVGTGAWAFSPRHGGFPRCRPISFRADLPSLRASTLYTTAVLPTTFMFRRSALRAVGAYSESERLSGIEDANLLERMMQRGMKLASIPARLYAYRTHSSIDKDSRDHCESNRGKLEMFGQLLGQEVPAWLPGVLREAHALDYRPRPEMAEAQWAAVHRIVRLSESALIARWPEDRRRTAWLFFCLGLKIRLAQHLPAGIVRIARVARAALRYVPALPGRLRMKLPD